MELWIEMDRQMHEKVGDNSLMREEQTRVKVLGSSNMLQIEDKGC